MTMTKTLEAHDKLIREIFEGSYQFEIPDYQRPYTWTTEQTKELFDDLYSAMQDARTLGVSSQYFLGSIVLIKADRDPKSFVVDGQQRLSTLTILFAVLRVLIPNSAARLTRYLYNEGNPEWGERNEYRLKVREEDADFFCTYIQEQGGLELLVSSTDKLEDSRLRYRENATLLLEEAKKLSSADLNALWKFLANDCSLVVISTPDLEAAYRIFSVLNNRGLDLAPIDIFKAQVLGQIRTMEEGDIKSRAYAKEWSGIESTLGREAFGDLLGHIRSLYAKKKQQYSLIKEFQEHVTEYKNKAPIDLIDKVIKPYAEVWDFVRLAEFEATEHAETINDYLSWLNRVPFKDWVPPALVYFKHCRQKPKLLVEFFKALERLTYFLLVTKADSNERMETYAELTRQIEAEIFKGDLDMLTTLALSDEQKRRFIAALDGDVYDNLPKARMVLVLRLESLVRAPGVRLDKAVSLEHVLPQTPKDGSNWLECFPDENERKAWTHRLSNLVLLDRNKNSSAGNYDFAQKKDVYFKGKGIASPFTLTQDVRLEKEWTPAILEDRQKNLLAKFKAHWAL
jgi:hypothetical protein